MARLYPQEPHASVGLQTPRQVEGTDRGVERVFPGPLQVHRRDHCSCWNLRCHPFLLPEGKPGPGALTMAPSRTQMALWKQLAGS